MTGSLASSESSVDSVSGVLPRAHLILTTIASAGHRGLRLKDIAEKVGIARPTVHRMLQDLAGIEYVTQLADRRYALGSALFWLGLAAPFTFPSLPTVTALADSLARKTGDTVYVSMRVPDGVRYLLRAEGDYPLQSRVVSPGDQKPFTASYSGLALLSTLPSEMQEAALRHIVTDEADEHTDAQTLEGKMREALAQVQTQGWCTGSGLVMPGLSGIAAPVPNSHGIPFAAVSVSAAEMRLTPERAEALAPELLKTVAAMSEAINDA